MVLTVEQRKQLVDKLNEIWKRQQCCVCGNSHWNISDAVFELREFHHGSMVVGGDSRIYPVIPLTCASCGNTIFLNAISLGLVKAAVPSQPEGPK